MKKRTPATEKKLNQKKQTKSKARKKQKDTVPSVTPRKAISSEERYQYISEAAYFNAVENNFENDPTLNWYAAEKKIDAEFELR